MSSERPEEFSEPRTGSASPISNDKLKSPPMSDYKLKAAPMADDKPTAAPMADDKPKGESAGRNGHAEGDAHHETTVVLVRGETLDSHESESRTDSPPATKDANSPAAKKEKSSNKAVSQAKLKAQSRLPALDDDADVGVQKAQLVTRDGRADLAFTGTLLASAASPSAVEGKWQEFRIYQTDAGKHVFSKVSRTVLADQPDTHDAEVFDPAPASVPSKLLRSARDLTHSRPMTWEDAAVAFFGYDPLAKSLYRKLSGQFEEHIS